MLVLGIETSCDETAAAVVDEHGRVYSEVIQTQIELHVPYGGIVPELAARDHVTKVPMVVRQAIAGCGRSLAELDGIAVTHRPGLAGALMVGLQYAKGLAWGSNLPLIGVDHLIGHLMSIFLTREDHAVAQVPEFPFVGLLISGGHTAIYRVDGPALSQITELGATRDDAAGEAFDKVAKLLGLGYPGGPVVDRLAHAGQRKLSPIALPKPAKRLGLEFSFSGLKSAAMRHVEQHGVPSGDDVAHFCAAFQHAMVSALCDKALLACEQEGLTRLVLGGGVAANRGLAQRLEQDAAAAGVSVFIPPLASCTDNAAMIAYVGAKRLSLGERDELSLATHTKTSLQTVTRKGGGSRSQNDHRLVAPR